MRFFMGVPRWLAATAAWFVWLLVASVSVYVQGPREVTEDKPVPAALSAIPV